MHGDSESFDESSDNYLDEYYQEYENEDDLADWIDDEDEDDGMSSYEENDDCDMMNHDDSLTNEVKSTEYLIDTGYAFNETTEDSTRVVQSSEDIEFESLGHYVERWSSNVADGCQLTFQTFDHENFLGYCTTTLLSGTGLLTTNSMMQDIVSRRLKNETSVLLESDLVREVIRMLMGVGGAVFHFNAQRLEFELRRPVAISAFSIDSLNHILHRFMENGHAAKIVEFVKRFSSKEHSSQTTQAFVYSVQCILDVLFTDLRKLDDEQCWNPCTLIQLLHIVEPYQNKTRLIFDLVRGYLQFTESVVHNPSRKSRESQYLLSMLYSRLLDLELIPEQFEGQYSLLLQLFSQTIVPYLDILDAWMFSACDYADSFSIYYMDPANEFMIEAREESVSNYADENFWESGYQVRQDSVPSFLRSMEQEVLVIGKSLRMITHILKSQLSTVGNFNELTDIIQSDKGRIRLADLFRQSCQQVMQRTKKAEQQISQLLSTQAEKVDDTDDMMMDITIDEESALEIDITNDASIVPPVEMNSYVRIIEQPRNNSALLAKLLDKPSLYDVLGISPDLNEQSKWYQLRCSDMGEADHYNWPISSIISDSLTNEIKLRNRVICPLLATKLIEDCKLLHHLTALRAIFLMEAGDVMDHFTTRLFEMMNINRDNQYGNMWDSRDISALNNALHESIKIGTTYPRRYRMSNSNNTFDSSFDIFKDLNLIDLLSIHITSKLDGDNYTEHKFFSSLRLHYNVSEPLNMIINTSSLKCYNEVFVFNLQIKRAKYLLERVSIPRPKCAAEMRSSSMSAVIIHRTQLLSAKLKHFVNNVQHYVMTRVLHNVWHELIDNLTLPSEARTFDHIKQHHSLYISRIQDRCLLKKAAFVMQQIHRILDLSCQLRTQFNMFTRDDEQYSSLNSSTNSFNASKQVGSYPGRTFMSESSDTSRFSYQNRQPESDPEPNQETREQNMLLALDNINTEFDKAVIMLITIVRNIIVARGGGSAVSDGTGAHEHLHELHNRLNFNSYYVDDAQ